MPWPSAPCRCVCSLCVCNGSKENAKENATLQVREHLFLFFWSAQGKSKILPLKQHFWQCCGLSKNVRSAPISFPSTHSNVLSLLFRKILSDLKTDENSQSYCSVKTPYVCMYVCVYVCMYVCMYVYETGRKGRERGSDIHEGKGVRCI